MTLIGRQHLLFNIQTLLMKMRLAPFRNQDVISIAVIVVDVDPAQVQIAMVLWAL